MSDLWGALPNIQNAKSPKQLLLEQAEKLSEKTMGVLRGAVRTSVEGSTIGMEFDVVAPYINNYSVCVARITHNELIFPLYVSRQLYEEGDYPEPDECRTFADFEKALTRVFQSSRVRQVIESLLIQSKE